MFLFFSWDFSHRYSLLTCIGPTDVIFVFVEYGLTDIEIQIIGKLSYETLPMTIMRRVHLSAVTVSCVPGRYKWHIWASFSAPVSVYLRWAVPALRCWLVWLNEGVFECVSVSVDVWGWVLYEWCWAVSHQSACCHSQLTSQPSANPSISPHTHRTTHTHTHTHTYIYSWWGKN